MTWLIAIVLRPLVFFILFVLVIAPITWVLYKIIPDGRWKGILFKIRTGEFASRRDKVIMSLAVLIFYIALLIFLAWYVTV